MNEMNNGFVPMGDPELDKRAKNAKIIGIVAIVVGFCCIPLAGIIMGIIGLVKANALTKMPELSSTAQSDAKVAKICSIVAIVLAVLVTVINAVVMMGAGSEYLNQMMQAGM